jgi:hypothetical protein
MGVQRGTKLELVLTGSNLAGPTGLWTSFPARITFPTDANNGKDNARLRVLLDVPADAPIGFHSIRLATTRGMSNFRPFCVDALPQVAGADSNHSKTTPQSVTAPCVICGRADAEKSDWYKFTAKAGQRLSFEIFGRRLGSAFDPQISLYDAKTGRDVPGGHSNDAPGLQTDARLTHTFKDGGDYLIEVRDVMYRGGADYYYRLRVGDFPCATTTFPLAIRRGTKGKLSFAGPNVEGVAPVEVAAPADDTTRILWATPKGSSGLPGWPVALAVSDLPEAVEQEPNNELARATPVAVPGAVSGRFLVKGDADHYVFPGKKGQRLIIETQTQQLNSPAELYLVLKDARGGQVAASNPEVGARIDYTPPADGNLTLVAEHLHYWGGPDETYRITVEPYQPGFSVAVAIERWDAPQGATFSVPLLATRTGYAGPIEVKVVGNPKLSGSFTIPAGQPPKPGLPAGTLTVKVAADAPAGPLTFALQCSASVGGKQIAHLVTAGGPVSQTTGNLPNPPAQYETTLALAVKSQNPFTLKVAPSSVKVPRGGKVKLKISADRLKYSGPIALEVKNLPPGVTAAKAVLAKSGTVIEIELTAAATAALGEKKDVQVVGTATEAGNATGTAPKVIVGVVKK